MANIVIFRHVLRDYDMWKENFDSDALVSFRKGIGLKDLYIMRAADFPNDITVIFEATDVVKLKEVYASRGFEDMLKGIGCMSKPIIDFLETI